MDGFAMFNGIQVGIEIFFILKKTTQMAYPVDVRVATGRVDHR